MERTSLVYAAKHLDAVLMGMRIMEVDDIQPMEHTAAHVIARIRNTGSISGTAIIKDLRRFKLIGEEVQRAKNALDDLKIDEEFIEDELKIISEKTKDLRNYGNRSTTRSNMIKGARTVLFSKAKQYYNEVNKAKLEKGLFNDVRTNRERRRAYGEGCTSTIRPHVQPCKRLKKELLARIPHFEILSETSKNKYRRYTVKDLEVLHKGKRFPIRVSAKPPNGVQPKAHRPKYLLSRVPRTPTPPASPPRTPTPRTPILATRVYQPHTIPRFRGTSNDWGHRWMKRSLDERSVKIPLKSQKRRSTPSKKRVPPLLIGYKDPPRETVTENSNLYEFETDGSEVEIAPRASRTTTPGSPPRTPIPATRVYQPLTIPRFRGTSNDWGHRWMKRSLDERSVKIPPLKSQERRSTPSKKRVPLLLIGYKDPLRETVTEKSKLHEFATDGSESEIAPRASRTTTPGSPPHTSPVPRGAPPTPASPSTTSKNEKESRYPKAYDNNNSETESDDDGNDAETVIDDDDGNDAETVIDDDDGNDTETVIDDDGNGSDVSDIDAETPLYELKRILLETQALLLLAKKNRLNAKNRGKTADRNITQIKTTTPKNTQNIYIERQRVSTKQINDTQKYFDTITRKVAKIHEYINMAEDDGNDSEAGNDDDSEAGNDDDSEAGNDDGDGSVIEDDPPPGAIDNGAETKDDPSPEAIRRNSKYKSNYDSYIDEHTPIDELRHILQIAKARMKLDTIAYTEARKRYINASKCIKNNTITTREETRERRIKNKVDADEDIIHTKQVLDNIQGRVDNINIYIQKNVFFRTHMESANANIATERGELLVIRPGLWSRQRERKKRVNKLLESWYKERFE